MAFILDGSVAMAWVFPDEAPEATEWLRDSLIDGHAFVPSLWPVEATLGGVLLKPAPGFPDTRPDDVCGRLACSGPPRTLPEMEGGMVAGAKRRRASD